MKLFVNKLNVKGLSLDFKTPLNLDRNSLTAALEFFLGKTPAESSESLLDNQQTNIGNYLDYINTAFQSNLTPEQLSNYITTNKADLESKVEKLSIGQAQEAPKLNAEQKYAILTSGMQQDQINNFNKMADIMVKIKRIEKEVDGYQNQKSNKENLNKKIKENENLKNALEQKLASVQSLLDQKTKVESEISKSSKEITTTDISSIKEKRIEELNKNLGNGFKKALASQSQMEESTKNKRLSHIWVEVVGVVQLALFFVYFLVSGNILFLLLGISLGVVITGVFFYLQKDHTNKNNKVEQVAKDEVVQETSVQNISTEAENQNILKSAYLNALNSEKTNIEESITKALENKTYEQVKSELDVAVKNIELSKKELENAEKNALDIDSYYKKRRELDILKIEKENLDFSSKLTSKPDEEYIKLLLGSDSSTTGAKEPIYLPLIIIGKAPLFDELIEKYNNIRQIIVLYENF